MKKSFWSAFAALILVVLASVGQNLDPTQIAAPMTDMLKNQLDSFRSLRLAGLVCSGEANRGGGTTSKEDDDGSSKMAEITLLIQCGWDTVGRGQGLGNGQ